jgi:hypothetical protein
MVGNKLTVGRKVYKSSGMAANQSKPFRKVLPLLLTRLPWTSMSSEVTLA